MRDAADIADFIAHNPRMMRCLAVLAAHGPTGAWIGAGFVRNAVWDHLSGQDKEATPLADLDVVFHDPAIATAEHDARIEAALSVAAPDLPWSVRNQARMHERNGHRPIVMLRMPWPIGLKPQPPLPRVLGQRALKSWHLSVWMMCSV